MNRSFFLFLSRWWNKKYTGELIMKDSRTNLIYLVLCSFFLLQSSVSAGFSLFIVLGSVAAVARSFWFRFIAIAIWIILLCIASITSDIIVFTKLVWIIFILCESIYLYRLWEARENKVVQPTFHVVDLIDTASQKENPNVPHSKLAIISMIAGGLGIFFGPLTTVPALIIGWIALKQIKKGAVKGKRFAQFGIGAFLVHAVFILTVTGYAIYIAGKPEFKEITGENAIKQMSEQEVVFLNTTLKQITADSTENDVVGLLGRPRRMKNVIIATNYYYDCPYDPSPECDIRIDFRDSKVISIGWGDGKRFFYRFKPGTE